MSNLTHIPPNPLSIRVHILEILCSRPERCRLVSRQLLCDMGLMILVSFPIITSVQAIANQSLAETKTACQDARLLIYIPELQQLSDNQCFYINGCLNAGGSVTDCYNAGRNINCNIENGKRYHCPPVLLGPGLFNGI